MGKLFSSFVLAGFVLISALANFGAPYAIAGHDGENRHSAHTSGELTYVDVENFATKLGQSTDGRDSGCRCDSDTDTKTFTCGVTLALMDEADVRQPSAPGKSRIVGLDTNGPKNFVDLLKRPPRSDI